MSSSLWLPSTASPGVTTDFMSTSQLHINNGIKWINKNVIYYRLHKSINLHQKKTKFVSWQLSKRVTSCSPFYPPDMSSIINWPLFELCHLYSPRGIVVIAGQMGPTESCRCGPHLGLLVIWEQLDQVMSE